MLNFENAHNEALRMQEKMKNNEAESFSVAEEEINKENISKIEKLNIGPAQKAEIMLISLGLKKSTELDLFEHNETSEEVEKALTEIGLLCRTKTDNNNTEKNTKAILAIAQEKEILDRLDKAEAYKDHAEYGNLMSYPESAIKAFLNKDLLLDEADYPSMKGIIFPLKLSKDNYQEEAKLLREWSEVIKKYSKKTFDELSGNTPEAFKNFQKYLSEQIGMDIGDIEKIKFNDADELLSGIVSYREQYEYLGDNRLEDVRIGLVPAEIWRIGKQPTESLADDHLILVNEKYFNSKERPDDIAWLLHELAHCKYLYDLDSPEGYEKDRRTFAFNDIKTGLYPNNLIEKYTFTEQFNFLKNKGKSREDIVEMLKEYYRDKSDFQFFDRLLDEVFGE